MNILVTTQVAEMPSDLPPSDFEFYIDYRKGEGPARRVFGATHKFIEACEACNGLMLGAIGTRIEPVVVLEDIIADSLRTKFRIIWDRDGEEAVKSGSLRRVIATYLVESYKIFTAKTNDASKSCSAKDIQDALDELAKNVQEDSRIQSTTPPISGVIDVAEKFDSVKDPMVEGDEAALVDADGVPVPMNRDCRIDLARMKDEAINKTYVNTIPNMILIVRKPDYLGDTQWELRHGIRKVNARIEDTDWLNSFQTRAIDVRPLDALDCRVREEASYGVYGELMASKFHIEKVHKVLIRGLYGDGQSDLEFPESDISE